MPSDNFSNQPIPPDNLPNVSAQQFTPLSKVYVKVNLLCRLVFWLVLVSVLLVLYWQPWFSLPPEAARYLPELQLAAGILGLLSSIYGVIADKQKGYAIREHDFSYRSGVLFKSVVSQPILRIQHVELKHGPIDRHFGLANLEIFSAGGSMYTFSIPGLPEEKALEMRSYVLTHGDIAAND
ncbi:PH domain-containing protein [Idiomarina sp. HP20-50]|uniref:PH domain-containing protein n=1 Tax=Idiomarina sp. HP20-50 TaxID=3070813 RepID=UPI00294AE8B1|nr:PH domain-containing protein [Idiomarina sp. HP20-50]MDV6314838.1 PH domain-containing protein [Idiomarina sp. HP20-50]